MLRRLGIRWKILAVLAVPIAVLTAGALLISFTAVDDSRATRQVANLIAAAEDMRSVVESLQHERYASMRLIQTSQSASDYEAIVNEVEQSRWLTDESLATLDAHTDIIDFDELDPHVFELVAETVEIHGRLEALRPRVDTDAITESAAFASYSDIIRNDAMLAARLGGLIEQRDPAEFLSAYSTLDLLTEYLKQERELGETVINTADRTERVTEELQTLVALQNELFDNANSALEALDTDINIPSIATNVATMRILVQTGSVEALERMDVDAWLDSINRIIDNVDPARAELISAAGERAETAADDARNQAIFTIGAAAIAVVVSLVLALIVSRGIVVPLRRLTGAAQKVRDDLPRLVEQVATPGVGPETELEHIPVQSRDEIGKLASAFNAVNETTVSVAREQAALRGSIAEMFVNVARRDQVLLNRQLAFITQLERTEEDPAQLEDLFRLDHLATRMRRNAESLLVLAGIDSGRRLRNPMAVSDVVRTASSEIEHYDRIDLVLTADPAVLGHAALTVAHLLAEFMENATVFSDPSSRVEVMTAMREDGVSIAITDEGLGMDAAAVAEVNEKVRSSSASDVIGAQRLGMFVVGRLAARHDIRIDIASAGEGQGTRVEVLLPMDLLDPTSVEQQQLSQAATVGEVPSTGSVPVWPPRHGANVNTAPAAPAAQLEDAEAGAVPPAATQRAGLFTGFHSVGSNPLESLESIDAATLDSSGSQAYVPLVSENRDDLDGLSRTGVPSTPVETAAISHGNAPALPRREVADQPELPQRSSAAASEPASAAQPENGEPAAFEDEPQTELRVYTGAFPTATGEYPTYTGEIPLHTADRPTYPSRRSRREMRAQQLESEPSVDHHIEFEPIDVEGAAGTEYAGTPSQQDPAPHQDPAPYQAGAAYQQRSEAGNKTVGDKPAGAKPKRKRFGLFGRKSRPEPQTPPVRESRFPTAASFSTQDDSAKPTTWSPEPHLSQGQAAEQLTSAHTGSDATTAETVPEAITSEPDPISTDETPIPPGTQAGAGSDSIPRRQPFAAQTSWAPTSENGQGALGSEAAEQLRRRSAITSEVLSELSQLSAYQPEAQHAGSGSSLTKRVPTEIPKANERETPAESARRRDASEVRSMLSGFQAGVNRAQAGGPVDWAQDTQD